jgi:type I restriction enzyme M protein
LASCTVRALRTFGRINHDEFGVLFQKWIYSSDPKPYGSWGNGAAMRVSPCAWVARSLDEALELARVVTGVTHNHPEGIKGAEAVTAAIFLARQGCSQTEIREYIRNNYYPNLTFTLDEIRDSYGYDPGCPGSVPQALEAFFEASSFEDAIRNAVSIGGDVDTIAAIAGSIAEAKWGVYDDMIKMAISYIDRYSKVIVRAMSGVVSTSSKIPTMVMNVSATHCSEKEQL